MANTPRLAPEQQFPTDAIKESIQVQPQVQESPMQGGTVTLFLATAADQITPWGRNTERRDRELRDFWPTEPYLAGAVANVSFRNAAFDWAIKSPSEKLEQAVTEMLRTALAGDKIGWEDFVKKISLDLYCLYGRSTVTLGGSRYGKKKTIQEIVEEKDEGPVLSIDKNGEIVERKIIQWEKTPLGGRSWVWISLESTSGHSRNKKGGLWITEDHPVMTRDGWVNAGDVTEGMSVASGHPSLNLDQASLLVGMLLGDASLSTPGTSSQIKLTHSCKQEEYMKLKMSAFRGMSWTPVNGVTSLQANSQVSSYFNIWRDKWYPGGKKVVPISFLETYFSPIMLAAWYLDDGSLNINKSKNGNETNPSAFISSQGFSKSDNEALARFLTGRGISTSVHEVKVGGKKMHRLYIGSEGSKVLFKTISKYVPLSMRYKIPNGYDAYDESLWNIGRVSPFFDKVVSAERKQLATGNGYVVQDTYHIGVQETRNFIANNIVVHNTQDNGAFVELIRDPGMDATSKFKGPMAPVIGIGHLDANRCMRTGNIRTPVLYKDRDERMHKLNWYDVITYSDFPSPIEKMNGVGYCSCTRALRLAQIMRSFEIYKDEKIGGRNPKDLHIVGGVAQRSIDDAILRTSENANNRGNMRFIENVVLASLDPEKPVSVATVELASLPEGFEFGTDMQWYIAGLALDFGVDYQEFAPLPGGNIGSSAQSQVLMRKTSGKGPRNWMDSITESFKNYGVLPRGAEMIFNDKNMQEEMEKQEVRTSALEEAAIAARSKILPRKTIAEDLVKRGIYASLDGIPEDFWVDQQPNETNNPVGQRGGNTIREDAGRQETGKQKETVGDRLRKIFG